MSDPKGEHTPQDTSKLLGPNTLSLLGVNSEDISVVTSWHQGGTETFVTDFLLTKAGETKHLFAKACIKFGPREAMNEWLQRRRVLEDNGVNLPLLYLVDGATIVEEYIPYEFSEAFTNANSDEQIDLKDSFIDTYKRVLGAGFSPVSLHDVRSRGTDTVVVDVGEDLGGPMTIDQCNLSVVIDAEKIFRKLIN